MTKIILIDSQNEIVIHSISIESKESARRTDQLWKDEEATRHHEVERLIVNGGMIRIMDRTDLIPVPVFSDRQVCHP
jgi:hypothetical protein